jgi:hypothetical protein
MVLAAALTFVLGVPAVWAHEGHAHKVMGTVATVQDNHLQVTTKEGKTVTIRLNEKTSVLRGKQKVAISDLQPGTRVVVDVGTGKEPLVATSVTVAPAKTTTTAAKK